MKFFTLIVTAFFVTFSQFSSIFGQGCSAERKCETVACCSKWGSCGFGPEFCGVGCLHDCDAKPECGIYADAINRTCPLKVCCSQYGFCGTTAEFCQQGCQNNCGEAPLSFCGADTTSLLHIGYYASWADDRKCSAVSISNIDPRNYTHLNYAFGTISGGVLLVPDEPENGKLHQFAGLKRINPNLKVLISVGGWVFNDPGPTQQEFHNIALSSGSRSAFISSVLTFLDNYGFDGIDIDWEYPKAPDRGGSPEDSDNYILLVQELREALGFRLVTIAAPASYWYLRHFKIAEMSKHLDWINVMTYDIHGVWDANNELGNKIRSHTNFVEIQDAIKLFLKDGVQPEKLVLGLGYYGRGFTLSNPSCSEIGCAFSGPSNAGECTDSPGTLAWFEIVKVVANTGVTPRYDAPSKSKILTWNSNQWIAYDDEGTLWEKTLWAAKVCLRGVMIWSIDQGIDNVQNDKPLTEIGAITLAHFEIRADYVGGRESPPAWTLTYDRTSMDGYDAYILKSPDLLAFSPSRQLGTGMGMGMMRVCQDFNSLLTLETAWIMAAAAYLAFGTNDPTTIGSHRQLAFDAWENPINTVEQRLISYNATGPVYRTEMLRAIIHPWHIAETRTDFVRDDYMYNYLNATRNQDDRGHIIASSLGGPGGREYYNMAPQYWRVNRHGVNEPNSWVNMETQIRQHFANGGLYAEYVVTLNYPAGELSGRPDGWIWAVRLVYQDENIDTREISGIVDNNDPSGTNQPRP